MAFGPSSYTVMVCLEIPSTGDGIIHQFLSLPFILPTLHPSAFLMYLCAHSAEEGKVIRRCQAESVAVEKGNRESSKPVKICLWMCRTFFDVLIHRGTWGFLKQSTPPTIFFFVASLASSSCKAAPSSSLSLLRKPDFATGPLCLLMKVMYNASLDRWVCREGLGSSTYLLNLKLILSH